MSNQCHALLRRGDGTRHKRWCLVSPAPEYDVTCPWGHVTRGPLCTEHAPVNGAPLLRYVWKCQDCHPCQAKGYRGWPCRALPTSAFEWQCRCGEVITRWICADDAERTGMEVAWGAPCPRGGRPGDGHAWATGGRRHNHPGCCAGPSRPAPPPGREWPTFELSPWVMWAAMSQLAREELPPEGLTPEQLLTLVEITPWRIATGWVESPPSDPRTEWTTLACESDSAGQSVAEFVVEAAEWEARGLLRWDQENQTAELAAALDTALQYAGLEPPVI